MVRKLEVISGSDQAPTVEFTDDVVWTQTELESAADNGASGIGRVILIDEGGVLPDYVGAGKFINSHNVVQVTDGPYTLFRGRIGARSAGRGQRKVGRTRTWEVTVGDYNTDLHGIVVNDWDRPAETDVARATALAAAYLAGSPRVTTNLATTYISSSNAVALPAKVYSGVEPNDVLMELAESAGKIFFVTTDGALFYDGTESTAYASTLRISDDVADENATTYEPQWDATAVSEEGAEQATALRLYYGLESSVQVTNTQAPFTDYWELLKWDDRADATTATTRANKFLEYMAQDTVTFSCTIGPIPWAQLGSIKAGQTIQFKARAARGGRNPTGTYIGDSFLTTRIRSLRWKFPAPDTNLAQLTLERPRKASPFGSLVEKALVGAADALDLAEGTDATFSLGSNIPLESFKLWETDGSFGAGWFSVPNAETESGVDLVSFVNLGCGSLDLWHGQRISYSGFRTQFTLPADSSYLGLELEFNLQSDNFAKGLRGGANGYEAPIKGPHLVTAGFTGNTFTTADIDGGAPVATITGNATTKNGIKVFIPSNMCPWGLGTRFVFQPMFRAELLQLCDDTGTAEDLAAGLGYSRPRDPTLKPISIATAGWVTGGIVGTQNGINDAFTLVGGWGDVASVSVNGLGMPLDDVDLTGGTPNIVFKGWAPLATDMVLVRYRSL